MSDLIFVAYLTAGTTLVVALMKILADINIRRYLRNKKLLKIYKGMDDGYVEMHRRRMPRKNRKWPTTLAARRDAWRKLRNMDYDTPNYKE